MDLTVRRDAAAMTGVGTAILSTTDMDDLMHPGLRYPGRA
jgi:hypothetical protein